MKMEELVNLSYEEKVYGYVEQDGNYEEYMFQKTPENIANFKAELLTKETRWRENGGLTSNLYRIS